MGKLGNDNFTCLACFSDELFKEWIILTGFLSFNEIVTLLWPFF